MSRAIKHDELMSAEMELGQPEKVKSLLPVIVKRNERARKLAWNLFRGAAVLQAIVLAVLFYQLKGTGSPISRISESQYLQFGQWLASQMQMAVPPEHYAGVARDWMAQNSVNLTVGLKSNPVELGGLIGLFVALLLVALFAAKRDAVTSALPPLAQIDALLYRTVSVAFPLLSLLLITGAVWANESWGRYWGWDSKEVGALVAWMAYAGFLHTRIAHGWRGRRSAYFALLGFALVIFTWLGVSFLLPGLHSYAGV
ncbi:MAG TPA: cytochrome c biogenesis protein CcsA [Blastocatellia bacterium]|nr:cytochrome c biogenesis protein CcsA [Blastocatellia bacterium]